MGGQADCRVLTGLRAPGSIGQGGRAGDQTGRQRNPNRGRRGSARRDQSGGRRTVPADILELGKGEARSREIGLGWGLGD